jgi:hypothetical protein
MTFSAVTLVALDVFGVAFRVALLRAVFFGVAFDLFDRVALRPTVRPPRLAAVTRVPFDARLVTKSSLDSIDSIGPPKPPYHIAPRRDGRPGVAATVNEEALAPVRQGGTAPIHHQRPELRHARLTGALTQTGVRARTR